MTDNAPSTFVPCCTEGCDNVAHHARLFTIVCPGGGEVKTTSWLCSACLDLRASETGPMLDLLVVGRVRR